VHVVRESGRAADAGDEHEVLGLDPGLGQHELNRGEDAVVAATGAPANLLVRLEVFACELYRRAVRVSHTSIISRIARSRSTARKGTPNIWVKLCASTRYSARTSRES